MPDSEERILIAAIQGAKTAEGSTIEQTLSFAEKLRPKKFKLKEITSSYDSKGNYIGFSVCYYIGIKRTAGDDYCSIGFKVVRSTRFVTPEINVASPQFTAMTSALMQGRDAFVTAVDAAYQEACVDPITSERTC